MRIMIMMRRRRIRGIMR
jgi:hypothetical protein